MLDKLVSLHDQISSDLVPLYHKVHEIHWMIDLNEEGKFLGFIETAGDDGNSLEEPIPYFRRAGPNPPPYLIVDKPAYVLGVGLDKFSDDKALKRHSSYVERTKDCADETGLDQLVTVMSFLRNHRGEAIANIPDGLSADDWLTISIGGEPVHRFEEVRDYWASIQEERAAEKSNLTSECLICGEEKAIVDRMPVEIQLGPERVQLISANENAYESYGLSHSEIAPVCQNCSLKYGRALRYLFDTDRHHLTVSNLTFAYWTESSTDTGFLNLLSEPDPEEVKNLLKSAFSGKKESQALENNFYALSASPNKSRMIIRSWLTTTVKEVKQNLAKYFERQRMVSTSGEIGRPLSIYSLAGSLVRDFDDLSPNVIPTLVMNALHGTNLPDWLLSQAVKRSRADTDNRMTHPRAALMKMVLNQRLNQSEAIKMEERLDLQNDNPAYLCGRLLGVLERIQQVAQPGINTTLVDRFYGTASSSPVSVFGNLMRKSQNHLSKLRHTNEGAHYALQNELEEILSRLDSFPKTLNYEEQGQFSLGYYHQRAEGRAQAIEQAKEKEKSDQTL